MKCKYLWRIPSNYLKLPEQLHKGYVGRIAVRYPEQGRQDAVALYEALRKVFPNDAITLE